jgi:hypothetical protein
MTNDELAALELYLRQHGTIGPQAADAITALRQERDAARDCVAFNAYRALEQENERLRALLLEFRKSTQFESNGQMYTLSGIPRELSRRIDAFLSREEK